MHLTQKNIYRNEVVTLPVISQHALVELFFCRCPATALKHRMETSPLTRRSNTLTQPTAPKMTICHCLIL